MYSPPEHLSNNPFIDGPSNAHTRFPDLNALNSPSPSSSNFGGSGGYGGSSGFSSYQAQSPYSSYQSSPPPQQQQPYTGGWGQGPASPTLGQFGGGFNSNSGYGGGGLYPQPTGLYQQQTGYPQFQQQQFTGVGGGYSYPSSGSGLGYNSGIGSATPTTQQTGSSRSYLSEFDPYSNSNSYSQGSATSTSNNASGGRQHPRDYVRAHKRELEIWDPVSWKQAINTFDDLRATWEGRKEQVDAQIRQGGYYLSPQDAQALQNMQREAINHIDSITASSIQMQEAFKGYRQSGDIASKNRVRESLNAALQGLPDFPS